MVEREVTQSYCDSTNDWGVTSPTAGHCWRVFEHCDSRRVYFRRGPSLNNSFKNTKVVANIVHFSVLPVLLRCMCILIEITFDFRSFCGKFKSAYQSCIRVVTEVNLSKINVCGPPIGVWTWKMLVVVILKMLFILRSRVNLLDFEV